MMAALFRGISSMLGSPDHTQYDLHFRLFGIPVRIHPLFWLVGLMLGGRGDLANAVLFLGCLFVSILIHELGHALSSRWQGYEPDGIVLYSMGGLCLTHIDGRYPWKRIIMIFSGPGAGFLLFGAVVLFLKINFGIEPASSLALIGVGNGDLHSFAENFPKSPNLFFIVLNLLWFNLVWGLFNLLPLWPLDGGQITSTFLRKVNPREGERWAHTIALLTAAVVCLWAISRQDIFIAIFVGLIGVTNFQILQSMHNSYRSYQDSDWGR